MCHDLQQLFLLRFRRFGGGVESFGQAKALHRLHRFARHGGKVQAAVKILIELVNFALQHGQRQGNGNGDTVIQRHARHLVIEAEKIINPAAAEHHGAETAAVNGGLRLDQKVVISAARKAGSGIEFLHGRFSRSCSLRRCSGDISRNLRMECSLISTKSAPF